MSLLITIFAVAGLVFCGSGILLGLGLVLRAVTVPGRGGVGFGIMLCLWWLPAVGVQVGLLQADAVVVVVCLGLWCAGVPVVFGEGSLRGYRHWTARRKNT